MVLSVSEATSIRRSTLSDIMTPSFRRDHYKRNLTSPNHTRPMGEVEVREIWKRETPQPRKHNSTDIDLEQGECDHPDEMRGNSEDGDEDEECDEDDESDQMDGTDDGECEDEEDGTEDKDVDEGECDEIFLDDDSSRSASKSDSVPTSTKSASWTSTSTLSGRVNDAEKNTNFAAYISNTSSSGSDGKGLIGMTLKGKCPNPGASEDEPNGTQDFLNCGVESGGWSPPDVKLSDLKMLSPEQAGESKLFAPCKKHLWAFKNAAAKHNVPLTVLLSFAFQESSCDTNLGGNGRENGLMQLTDDKCGGAPKGDCKMWGSMSTKQHLTLVD